MGELETVEALNEIIRLQSEIIDGLYARLSLLLTPDDDIPEVIDIKRVCNLKKEVDL